MFLSYPILKWSCHNVHSDKGPKEQCFSLRAWSNCRDRCGECPALRVSIPPPPPPWYALIMNSFHAFTAVMSHKLLDLSDNFMLQPAYKQAHTQALAQFVQASAAHLGIYNWAESNTCELYPFHALLLLRRKELISSCSCVAWYCTYITDKKYLCRHSFFFWGGGRI